MLLAMFIAEMAPAAQRGTLVLLNGLMITAGETLAFLTDYALMPTRSWRCMRVLTDPVDTGAVTLCLPQDVQTEAYHYPASFFEKRVHELIVGRFNFASRCQCHTTWSSESSGAGIGAKGSMGILASDAHIFCHIGFKTHAVVKAISPVGN